MPGVLLDSPRSEHCNSVLLSIDLGCLAVGIGYLSDHSTESANPLHFLQTAPSIIESPPFYRMAGFLGILYIESAALSIESANS